MSAHGTALMRQLCEIADAPCVPVAHEHPWASCTFEGARHVIALTFSGPHAIAAAERILTGLEDREFKLERAFVADIGPAGAFAWDGCAGVKIEALVIDAC